MSPVTALLFNYYCFQIPFSIHSSIYVLIGPFNNQKIETTKVRVCILPVINYLLQVFSCLVALGLYQPACFLLGLVASNVKTGPERKKAEAQERWLPLQGGFLLLRMMIEELEPCSSLPRQQVRSSVWSAP